MEKINKIGITTIALCMLTAFLTPISGSSTSSDDIDESTGLVKKPLYLLRSMSNKNTMDEHKGKSNISGKQVLIFIVVCRMFYVAYKDLKHSKWKWKQALTSWFRRKEVRCVIVVGLIFSVGPIVVEQMQTYAGVSRVMAYMTAKHNTGSR